MRMAQDPLFLSLGRRCVISLISSSRQQPSPVPRKRRQASQRPRPQHRHPDPRSFCLHFSALKSFCLKFSHCNRRFSPANTLALAQPLLLVVLSLVGKERAGQDRRSNSARPPSWRDRFFNSDLVQCPGQILPGPTSKGVRPTLRRKLQTSGATADG
jgi:hypothetical protein